MAAEIIDGGSVLSPNGYRAGFSACGIKTTEGAPDVALLVSDRPAAAAGVFTRNKFAAASVQWDRSILPSDDLRAVVVSSGNANACTGERGLRDTEATAALVAELLGCEQRQVAVSTTGIIGHPLPMDRLREGIRAARSGLSDETQAARGAETVLIESPQGETR